LGLWLPGRLAILPPEQLRAWRRLRWRLVWPHLGVGCTGLVASLLAESHPAWPLAVLPIGLALRQAALAAVAQGRTEQLAPLETEVIALRATLAACDAERDRLRQDLHDKLDQLLLLRELAVSLHRAVGQREVFHRVLAVAVRLTGCRNVTLYLPEGDGLYPEAGLGPEVGQPGEARLLDLRDKLVERCWREGLSISEPGRLVLPIAEVGVLGLAGPDPPDEASQSLLSTLAAQASLVVQSARRSEAVVEALEQNEQARERLESWVSRLSALLEGFRQTAASLDSEQLLERLEGLLGRLIPHDSMVLHTDALERATPGVRLDPDLRSALSAQRLPLLVEDAGQVRFHPLVPGQRSLLAAPLLVRDQVVGVVALGAANPHAFVREHQDLLMVLAYQAAVVLQNAQQHRSLAEAYRRLQESEAQLIQSSKLAAVGQLAAGVAHELNNPLGAAVLAVDSAAESVSKRPERALDRLEQAQSALQRARSIVDKLLFYSREGRQAGQMVDLDQVVADTLHLMRRQLALDGVKVTVHEGAPPSVLASHNEMQQVLTNLLLNARDCLQEKPPDERRVTVSTGTSDNHAFLEVEDTGPGIAAEVLPRIFEPFFTTRPVGRGTGLGLSISQKIVADHHGTLEVTTRPGQGTRFRVTLPAATGAA
ncbi:MAG: ATP-binding protein, partial [Candidatus Eremiobacterota bacterium]